MARIARKLVRNTKGFSQRYSMKSHREIWIRSCTLGLFHNRLSLTSIINQSVQPKSTSLGSSYFRFVMLLSSSPLTFVFIDSVRMTFCCLRRYCWNLFYFSFHCSVQLWDWFKIDMQRNGVCIHFYIPWPFPRVHATRYNVAACEYLTGLCDIDFTRWCIMTRRNDAVTRQCEGL